MELASLRNFTGSPSFCSFTLLCVSAFSAVRLLYWVCFTSTVGSKTQVLNGSYKNCKSCHSWSLGYYMTHRIHRMVQRCASLLIQAPIMRYTCRNIIKKKAEGFQVTSTTIKAPTVRQYSSKAVANDKFPDASILLLRECFKNMNKNRGCRAGNIKSEH